ncbi:hypothetical protein [Bacillus kexueae]|nr:hypothetical protein [Bacillus kexueae]
MLGWVRLLIIGCFSLTAMSLFFYQGVEIIQAFLDYFHSKHHS